MTMNRRDFFHLSAALLSAPVGVLAASNEVRRVEFSPPGESFAIWWMPGHIEANRFVSLLGEMENIEQPVQPSHIKQAWGTRKLDGICIYLSDEPLENFEPITYWIPAGYSA